MADFSDHVSTVYEKVCVAGMCNILVGNGHRAIEWAWESVVLWKKM